jgi:AraC-like DNA-binding protein
LEMLTSKSLDARIQRALDLIHHGFSRQYTVSELARYVGLSESYFHHLFRREVKVTPARYLDDLKLREAEHLIRTTALSVKDICVFVGVDDRSHFIRKFKRLYGLPPALYRLDRAGAGLDCSGNRNNSYKKCRPPAGAVL